MRFELELQYQSGKTENVVITMKEQIAFEDAFDVSTSSALARRGGPKLRDLAYMAWKAMPAADPALTFDAFVESLYTVKFEKWVDLVPLETSPSTG